MKSECDERLLLDGILSQARVDGSEIRRLLSQSHVRASDLIAEPEHRVEAMLQACVRVHACCLCLPAFLSCAAAPPSTPPPPLAATTVIAAVRSSCP